MTGAVPERRSNRERGARARATWTSSRARRSSEIAARPGLHRLLHELADRGPARGRRDGRGPPRRRHPDRDGRPGLRAGQAQAEAEGLDEVFRAAGFDWRSAGCSMCLGMNPDILSPGRALRLDLEPELRGPPGQGRAHPPGSPRDGRRGGDRGPASSTSGSGHDARRRAMEPVSHRGQRLGARPRRRRHRPDHPQAVPEAGRAHRLRRVPLLRLDPRRRDRARAEPDPGHGPQLRLRIVARARALGASGLRLRGDRRALVRRHLLRQLHEDRAAAGDPRRAALPRGRGGRRGPDRPRRPDRRLRGGRRALRDRRGDQAPAPQRPRRHRAHPPGRRRDRRLRGGRAVRRPDTTRL